MKILFNPLTDNKLCLIQKILQEKKLVGEISDDTVISPDMIDFLTDELTLRTGKCVKFKEIELTLLVLPFEGYGYAILKCGRFPQKTGMRCISRHRIFFSFPCLGFRI